ncbi:hypothetical protein [Saccharothrix saharensis]|nr:hypothetical protein [Saccharothrix saharensis]
MPGRTPSEAFDAFVDPLKEALSCLAHAKINVTHGGRTVVDEEHSLYLNRATAVELKGPARLELGIRMRYKIIRDESLEKGPFRVTTLAYDYLLARKSGEAVLNFHWHPSGKSHNKQPHIHVGTNELANDSVLTNKIHVPTGRVSVEQVLRAAIELGVQPIIPDWADRLNKTEAPFLEHRTWG